MQLITYSNAAELLNRPYGSIRQYVHKGILSRYVEGGKLGYLIKEQVTLFKGKARISLRSLNLTELETWKKYDEIAKKHAFIEDAPIESTSYKAPTAEEIAKALIEQAGGTLQVQETVTRNFHYAPQVHLEGDNEVPNGVDWQELKQALTSDTAALILALLLLAGLIVYILHSTETDKKIYKWLKEQLGNVETQEDVKEVLENDPDKIIYIMDFLQKENLIAV